MKDFVTSLLPALSGSLAEQFNIFRVMHHGTHEKQLSNVFAWLLTPDSTHQLGDTSQRIFLERVNAALPNDGHMLSSRLCARAGSRRGTGIGLGTG
ncbi:PD-(D/E)XK nuclease family protein [Pseudactinotalea sp. Z1748]|uniref:PD-(D/E)XK nuclease family protein n=1 Tax=Pseudactinotalea sp. Z1748 TaxID=3413027 RepID=UPI003C7CBB02